MVIGVLMTLSICLRLNKHCSLRSLVPISCNSVSSKVTVWAIFVLVTEAKKRLTSFDSFPLLRQSSTKLSLTEKPGKFDCIGKVFFLGVYDLLCFSEMCSELGKDN